MQAKKTRKEEREKRELIGCCRDGSERGRRRTCVRTELREKKSTGER